jgi:hypothetical protein
MSETAGSVRWGDASNSSIGSIEYNHNSDYMRLIVNAAERMRITSSGNINIGTGAASDTYVRIYNASSGDITAGYQIYNGSNLDLNIYTNPLFGNSTFFSRETFSFNTSAGAKVKILNNGNVGIGTTTPGAKFQTVQTTSGEWTGDFKNYTAVAYGLRVDMSGSSSVNAALQVYTGAGTGVIIKNNGLVGIGTFTPGTALAFGGFGSIWVNNDTTNPFGMDTVGGELRLFVGTGAASYQMKFGKYSGTTFTPHMTIGDDGSNPSYVGIGTTSPSSKLQVKGDICVNSESVSTATAEIDKIVFKKSHPNGVSGYYELGEIRSKTYGGYSGGLNFYTGRATTPGSYASTFAMAIDNKGQVGIGNESLPTDVYTATGGGYAVLGMGQSSFLTAYKADDSIELCQNTYVKTNGTNQGVIASVPATRLTLVDGQVVFASLVTAADKSQTATNTLKIDTSGVVTAYKGTLNLGVNSSDTGTAYLWSSANDSRMSISNTGSAFEFKSTYLTTAGYKPIDFYTSDLLRLRITSAGRIKAPSLAGYTPTGSDLRYDTSDGEIYYQTSSKRYKTDIVNLESSLDKINTLRPVRYKDINTGEPNCGLIAEETFEIIPEVVFTKKIEGFDEPQIEGLNYSDLVPFLIKSIQELKAEIELLKSK